MTGLACCCMQSNLSMQKLLALNVHGNARQVCGLTNQSSPVPADLFRLLWLSKDVYCLAMQLSLHRRCGIVQMLGRPAAVCHEAVFTCLRV